MMFLRLLEPGQKDAVKPWLQITQTLYDGTQPHILGAAILRLYTTAHTWYS